MLCLVKKAWKVAFILLVIFVKSFAQIHLVKKCLDDPLFHFINYLNFQKSGKGRARLTCQFSRNNLIENELCNSMLMSKEIFCWKSAYLVPRNYISCPSHTFANWGILWNEVGGQRSTFITKCIKASPSLFRHYKDHPQLRMSLPHCTAVNYSSLWSEIGGWLNTFTIKCIKASHSLFRHYKDHALQPWQQSLIIEQTKVYQQNTS